MLGLAWKSLGWFVAVVAVALGFLLVPLQVAAERKKLDHTAGEILRAKRDIRALETEFETRASLAQLDRWNADTLKLVAPAADQFVSDEQALAAVDVHGTTGAGAVTQVAFVPAAPGAVSASPPAPVTPAATPSAPTRAASAPAPVARAPGRTAMAVAAPAPARRRDVALLDRALLDDSMIGDLRSGARAEIGAERIETGRIGTGR